MSLWGNLDAGNNAPKQTDTTGYGGDTPQVTSNGQVYYANTQIDAYIGDAAIGIFGVDTTEQAAATAAQGVPQHAGWVLRKVGMGPITTVTANAGAVGVNATMTITGGSEGLWEIAILDRQGEICYDTPITDDVIGWVEESAVSEILYAIHDL